MYRSEQVGNGEKDVFFLLQKMQEEFEDELYGIGRSGCRSPVRNRDKMQHPQMREGNDMQELYRGPACKHGRQRWEGLSLKDEKDGAL